jgi:hypothetical protein
MVLTYNAQKYCNKRLSTKQWARTFYLRRKACSLLGRKKRI